MIQDLVDKFRIIILICFIFFLGFFLASNIEAQELDNKLPTIDEDGAVLDENYNLILDYRTTEICLNNECDNRRNVIEYLYITSNLPDKNIISYNTERAGNKLRIFVGQPWIKVDDTWHETGIEYVDPDIFTQVQNQKLLSLKTIIDKINPLHFYSLSAQTYYAGDGDGRIASDNASWATARAGGTIAVDNTSPGYFGVREVPASTDYAVYHAYFPVDTSAIPSTSTIESASLFIYLGADIHDDDNDPYAYMAITTSTQADTSVLQSGDFAKCGYSPGSEEFDITLMTPNEYNEFALDETGLTWIDKDDYTKLCFLEGHDIENFAIDSDKWNGSDFYFSDEAGTDKDPYLEITLESEEETPTTTPIIYNSACTPEDPDDLSWITSCSFASTTGVTYTNYRIRFIIYLLLLIPMLWVMNILLRLYEERIIKWTKN